MLHALQSTDESPESVGFSPSAGRPLFVPPGIAVVRTGRTTQAELARLLADAADADSSDVSGVRVSPAFAAARAMPRWLTVVFRSLF